MNTSANLGGPVPQPIREALEIQVLQHRGHDVENYLWQFPAHLRESSFEAVLAGLMGADRDMTDQLRACTLQQVGSPQQAVWIMGCTHVDLHCSVNRKPLPYGSHIRLEHGDEIELAQTRMQVLLQRPQAGTQTEAELLTARMAQPWQAVLQSMQAARDDPLQHWEQAASRPNMVELLQPLRSMEQLMGGMDRHGDKDLLAPQNFAGIMQQLTPQHLYQQVQDSLQGLTRLQQLPQPLVGQQPFEQGGPGDADSPDPAEPAR